MKPELGLFLVLPRVYGLLVSVTSCGKLRCKEFAGSSRYIFRVLVTLFPPDAIMRILQLFSPNAIS